jgi:hypothetical protein
MEESNAEQINKEDARINERVTWGISINGGLLALLGVAYTPPKDVYTLHCGQLIISMGLALLAAGHTRLLPNHSRRWRCEKANLRHQKKSMIRNGRQKSRMKLDYRAHSVAESAMPTKEARWQSLYGGENICSSSLVRFG